MVMLVAEAVAAGAPHTGLAGEPVAEAIAEAEATQTATSPVPHTAAMMPVVELKKYNARSPPRQATMTASPLLTVKIRQPSHEFTFGVGISFIPYPLVLTPVV
jgi:hypothetical protein